MSNKVRIISNIGWGLVGIISGALFVYEGVQIYKDTKASECECDADTDSENPVDVEC